jgi:hypothetical protein
MGSYEGVLIVAAKKVGLPIEKYLARKSIGLKWCTACKEWHKNNDFCRDNSRTDGLAAVCRKVSGKRPKGYRDPKKVKAQKIIYSVLIRFRHTDTKCRP